jgi:hypothetical protein
MFCPVCFSEPCRYAALEPMTEHAAPASPMLARRYAYLHSRGIALIDWSTDEDVADYKTEIEQAIKEAPHHTLAEDLACLLRRVPDERADEEASEQ